jgi:hypothetical protein
LGGVRGGPETRLSFVFGGCDNLEIKSRSLSGETFSLMRR